MNISSYLLQDTVVIPLGTISVAPSQTVLEVLEPEGVHVFLS